MFSREKRLKACHRQPFHHHYGASIVLHNTWLIAYIRRKPSGLLVLKTFRSLLRISLLLSRQCLSASPRPVDKVKLNGYIVMTEHNTVFARSGQLSVHKLFASCIRRCLVSRACEWVMSALSAALLIFSFQFSLLFFHMSVARQHQHCGVLLVLIRNIGHRMLPKIWVGTFPVRNVQPSGKILNWF